MVTSAWQVLESKVAIYDGAFLLLRMHRILRNMRVLFALPMIWYITADLSRHRATIERSACLKTLWSCFYDKMGNIFPSKWLIGWYHTHTHTHLSALTGLIQFLKESLKDSVLASMFWRKRIWYRSCLPWFWFVHEILHHILCRSP